MGISFADDRCINIYDVPFAGTFFHTVNGYSNSMRYLCIQSMKGLFPDDLCCDLSLGLICDSIFIIKHRAIRKILENAWDNIFCILCTKSRNRYDLIKIIKFTVSINGFENLIFVYSVYFVDNKNHRKLQSG